MAAMSSDPPPPTESAPLSATPPAAPPLPLPHDCRRDVLSDEDLLDVIFGFIQADIDRIGRQNNDSSKGYQPRCQLLSLALTCKALLEPALNALWHSLPTLLPLIRLIRPKSVFDDTYVRAIAPLYQCAFEPFCSAFEPPLMQKTGPGFSPMANGFGSYASTTHRHSLLRTKSPPTFTQ